MPREVVPIDVELMREYIAYDPESGRMQWKKKPCSRIVVGADVGCVKSNKHPYIVFKLFGQVYLGHRVAWAIHNNSDIPCGHEIDHRNGNKSDNSASNLRLALPHQNKSNMDTAQGVSGLRGVTWDKSRKKWIAQISSQNKCLFLGRFDTKEEAYNARKSAEEVIQAEYSYEKSRGEI